MSEQLLKAILNLFVIVVKEDDITESERKQVIEFLKQHLNSNNFDTYLDFFDKKGAEVISAVDDLDDEKEIGELCKQINIELTKKQKTVLIKELIELILADGSISEKENELVTLIASTIHIESKEVDDLKQFVLANKIEDFDPKQTVFITDQDVTLNDAIGIKIVEGISGYLAFIYINSSDTYFIKYLGDHELSLNNISLPPEKIQIFPPGSSIRGLKFSPIYYSDVVGHFLKTAEAAQISFEANNISYRFSSGDLGLRNISIGENSGKMIGLMGASGAGKSTLLNVLNGSDTPFEGEVLINGFNIHTEKNRIEGVVGFVPQDDLLIEDLTVYQNLYFAAKLCFKELSETDIDRLVKKTLQSLGLLETKNLRVGSPLEKTISGGQRKRLNIGLELLREPAVLFADEPTSGLSSRDSENIMDLLKELSLKGKLVFVVIHQPSSDLFKMFDKLVILDVGGYQIYYGDPVEAVVYFKDIINVANKNESACTVCGNVNPEQIFNIIETKIVDEYGKQTNDRKILPEEWNNFYQKRKDHSGIEKVTDKPPSSLRIPNLYKQFNVFLIRDLLSKIGNRQYMIINILEAPFLAFILAFIVRYFSMDEDISLGYVFSKNINLPSYMFMSIIVSLFMGLTVSAEEIIRDRKILKREAFLNLSKGSYLGSKIVLLFSLTAFQSYLFVLVGNTILDINGMFAVYWLVMFSTGCFANILGLNISSAFNSAVTIYILIPILLIPQLMLSGAVVKFDKLNPQITNESYVPLVGDIMTSRWALEALMITQFKDNKFESIFYETDKKLANTEYKKLYYLPKLKTKLESINQHYLQQNMEGNEDVKYDLDVLKNEIDKELEIVGKDQFAHSEDLTIEGFNTDVSAATLKFINELNNYYVSIYNNGVSEKDQIFRRMNETPEKAKTFEKLRQDYQNEAISALVRNVSEPQRIVERHGKFIRKINPVYMKPVNQAGFLDFRTQFYVAEKHFAGIYIPTIVFNLSVIWFLTILLSVTLYYDLLKRLMTQKR